MLIWNILIMKNVLIQKIAKVRERHPLVLVFPCALAQGLDDGGVETASPLIPTQERWSKSARVKKNPLISRGFALRVGDIRHKREGKNRTPLSAIPTQECWGISSRRCRSPRILDVHHHSRENFTIHKISK